MTTTPHHDGAAARYRADLDAPAGLGTPYPGQGDPWTGLPGVQFPYPRTPDQAQPYLTFPTARRPQPSSVLATRIVGLIATILAALWPAFFALIALAFGLGMENLAGILVGVVVAVLAIGWPVAFWFATSRARRVRPVLVALVPTVVTAGWTLFLVISG
ncbi:hypothetical protein [Pseudonocardia xishanensis]|uniref:Uncharacterized protein n=1 Tax=Pseudonocardia xishanensis TaxID=630995 RepID=A0ABP8RK43_9PSEU